MKNFIRFVISVAFSFALLLASFLNAQYPEYRWVNPYPRTHFGLEQLEEIKPGTAWFAEKCEGLHQCKLSVEGKFLKVVSSGHDPYFTMPRLANPVNGPLEISVRMRSTMGSGGEFFWMSKNLSHAAPDRSAKFDTENDGKWHEYSVLISCEDTVNRLRFDPGTSEGECEIEWIRISRAILSPLEITNMFSDNNHAEIEITNHSDKAISSNVYFGANSYKKELPPGKTAFKAEFPKKHPFELLVLSVSVTDSPILLFRDFHAYHKGVETDWITISGGDVKCRFAKGGSGAEVYRNDKLVGIINQFAYDDGWLPPNKGGYNPIEMRNVAHAIPFGGASLVVESSNKNSIRFVSDPKFKDQPVEHLDFMLTDDGILKIERESQPLFGPVFRPFGTMEQAVLCGQEYLERGEHSSSIADIETPEHVRIAPPPLQITLPFMGIITDEVSFGLLWDDPMKQPIFAIPDYIEGKKPGDLLQHRMSLYGGGRLENPVRMELRIGPGYGDGGANLEDAILWAVKSRGLPSLPQVPRDRISQDELSLTAFEKSIICGKDGGWQHASIPGGNAPFPFMYGSDFVSTIWELSGKLPEVPRLDYGGGHIHNHASYLLMNKADQLLEILNAEARRTRAGIRDDGSVGYEGVFRKGHWADSASGHTANASFTLLEHWRLTGNKESLDAALKALEYVNKQRTPRGAQVWELSLHTPDIMGSSRAVLSNTLAYEATGEKKYLDQAKRWAITGLPFVYQWECPLAGKEHPVMLYATIPVFGATHWNAPNWIGLPVQWCGLDYAEALFRFAPYDNTLDWVKIAEGILISGEQQQYLDGPSIGLLPDSWTMKSQRPNPYDIHPCTLVMMRRRVEGEVPGIDVQVDADKKYRIVSPYKTRIEGDTAIIEAVKDTEYQIILNGHPRTIESQGTDRVDLRN